MADHWAADWGSVKVVTTAAWTAQLWAVSMVRMLVALKDDEMVSHWAGYSVGRTVASTAVYSVVRTATTLALQTVAKKVAKMAHLLAVHLAATMVVQWAMQ